MPKTKAEAADYTKDIKAKEHQIGKNNKQGQAALKTGKFTLIKDRGTIDRKLDVKVINGKKNI